jgi:putative flippase GtrA
MAVTSSILNLTKLALRFLLSGGIATLLHWATLWGLVTLQFEALWASGIGALVGAVANYFLQYFFTFKSKRTHKQAVLAYVPTVMVSWVLNLAVFYGLYTYALPNPMVAQMVTTGLVMVVNFVLYKKVVFRAKSDT